VSINVTNAEESCVTITLSERFDFGLVESFREIYEGLVLEPNSQIIIDFLETKYMDSSALGMLINAQTYFVGNDVKIVLTNCNIQIKKILSISRFDKKFTIL